MPSQGPDPSRLLGVAVTPPLVVALGLGGALAVIGAVVPVATIVAFPRLLVAERRAAITMRQLRPVVELLSGLAILRHASPPVIETLAATAERHELWAGDVVIAQGDRPDDFYAIAQGHFKVLRTGADGRDELIGVLGPGDGFGEVGLLGGQPRDATVAASSRAVVLRIHGAAFVNSVTSSPITSAVGPIAANVPATV